MLHINISVSLTCEVDLALCIFVWHNHSEFGPHFASLVNLITEKEKFIVFYLYRTFSLKVTNYSMLRHISSRLFRNSDVDTRQFVRNISLAVSG